MQRMQWLVFLVSLSLLFRAGYAVSENQSQAEPKRVTLVLTADMPNIGDPVSYTHLTLPTMMSV